VKKSIKEDATDVAYKWQLVAPNLDKDLLTRVQPNVVNGTVIVSFIGQFLGPIKRLVPLVSEAFPELGLKQSDCSQMPWINSTLFWYDLSQLALLLKPCYQHLRSHLQYTSRASQILWKPPSQRRL